MVFGSSKRDEVWRIFRSLRRGQLISLCLTFQVGALLGGMWLFVAQPLADLQKGREKLDTEASAAQLARVQLDRIRTLRAEQVRLGFDPSSQALSENKLEEGKQMNFLFEQMSGVARGVGISIRSFERAGQGLNSSGFAQLNLDTNFLQMISFLSALSQISIPLHISEFSARQTSRSLDKISFSLTISLPTFERDQQQLCSSF